ncbi:MAG TPA: hypothetical protein VMP01_18370 [Pirellulaceae bacterium]|nr:hypothetical protein [Pirellulaceae bacterium]
MSHLIIGRAEGEAVLIDLTPLGVAGRQRVEQAAARVRESGLDVEVQQFSGEGNPS